MSTDTPSLLLLGYECLAEHGFALPLFGAARGANTWYVAQADVPDDPAAVIRAFVPYNPEALIHLREHLHRKARPGEPWLDVFLWQGVAHVGTAKEIWQALGGHRADIEASAPFSFLQLAGQAGQSTQASAKAALAWWRAGLGESQARVWQFDSYLRGLAIQGLRRALGARALDDPLRTALFDVEVVPEEDGGTVVLPVCLAHFAESDEAMNFGALRTGFEAFGLRWHGVRASRDADLSPDLQRLPEGFSEAGVEELVLRGEAIPQHWVPHIVALDFRRTRLRELQPLRDLSALKALDLSDTQVTDLAPLAGLSALQTLDCSNTHVADLAPLAGLFALQVLDCWSTRVTDLAPLATLSALQTLDCTNTRVADLAALSGLSELQTLYCGNTQVTDLAPLAGLSALKSLYCANTQVVDLSPLAGLSALQILHCANTQVADLMPLAGLSALQALHCANTQVAYLQPLAGLRKLRTLDIRATKVQDILPIKSNSRLSVQFWDDGLRAVSDLAPDGSPAPRSPVDR
ncbi:leucine-rich repeat domain-containing protein [Roseomonas sp. F4]